MGATQWSYFVPYQPDINTALARLKDDLLEQWQYEQPLGVDREELESQLDYLESVYQSLPSEIRGHADEFIESARVIVAQQSPKRSPKSLEQLMEQCGTEGTHSILDMATVSAFPAFGMISPVPQSKLQDLFGTDQPTRETVEKWSERVELVDAEPLYGRWEGIYIVVYRGTEPVEIYFEGCSGD